MPLPGAQYLSKWRGTFEGNKLIRDGVTWDWCKHHKLENVFDGLYYKHPHDHAAWKKSRAEFRAKRRSKVDQVPTPSNSSVDGLSQRSLALKDSMKAALLTDGSALGVADVDSMVASYQSKH